VNAVELSTFEEFEREAARLLDDLRGKRGESGMCLSPLLFRGHSNASWELKSTLERYSPRQYSMEDYYRVMLGVRPAVESFTDKSWDLSHEYSMDESFPQAPQGYDFMVYLRHHGFPSPLLDWSRSPYVAAFFASHAAQCEDEANVAIYSFVEYYEGSKAGSVDEATIVSCGPYITTHKRHFSQQSEYKYCKKRTREGYVYCSHEEAFLRNDSDQDVLTKFIIPRTERSKVMERLYLMNITAYSLFGSEESLLSTLAYQEIEKRPL
jgi:hypothetical protein